MHIETLKTFRDVVETGSFSRAAELNFVSQSAVSQQLKMLERRYDCVLLERTTRGRVTMTDAGRLFYAECKELLDRFGAVEARLRDRPATVSGTVRIATVYSVGLHALPPFVTRLMQAHPGVKVHVEYSRTDKVCEACVSGTIDVGIVAFPVRRPNLVQLAWRDEPLVLVCGRGHRLARRRRVSVQQLRNETLIAFERDIPTRKTIDRLLKRHGLVPRVAMEFDNVETIKRSVEVGSGVSILPESTVANEVRSGLLTKLELAEGGFSRQVGLVYRRGRVLGPAARAFIQLLGPAVTPLN